MVTKPLNQPRQPFEDEEVEFEQDVYMPEETRPSLPPVDLTPERAGPAWRVLFHITGSQATTVGLDIWRVTVLGRGDARSAFRPDLDFGPYGATRHGVSRRHALIRPGEQSLFLIDQNSTNGTWVNGQRLLHGRDFPLSDDDTIELGALRMTLRIVHSPLGKKKKDQSDKNDPFFGRPFRWTRR